MHLARFPSDRNVLIAFTIIPPVNDPTASLILFDLFENALDDIAFMHLTDSQHISSCRHEQINNPDSNTSDDKTHDEAED